VVKVLNYKSEGRYSENCESQETDIFPSLFSAGQKMAHCFHRLIAAHIFAGV